MIARSLRLSIFGAAPDTANLGVSALCYGMLAEVARLAPQAEVTVFDYGRGERDAVAEFDGRRLDYRRLGGYRTRRLYLRESLWNIRMSARLGGLGNPGARALRRSDAVLDISGGDSFSELYGPHRFRAITAPKLLALDLGRPLVLMPQTYGPFVTTAGRERAAHVARAATLAWSRDEESFATLRELLGNAFDPERHRSGVDVAFVLPARRPASLSKRLEEWLDDRAAAPIVGVNASGLIYNDREAAHRYGLVADYRATLIGFTRRLLERTECRLLLVPHVLAPSDQIESDPRACEELARELGGRHAARVHVQVERVDPSEVKWLISKLEFFCGTRMHSTIAALSTEVPVAALAYSKKTHGVFATCGQESCVADLRSLETEAVVEQLWNTWERRRTVAHALRERIAPVRARAQAQMERILASVRERP